MSDHPVQIEARTIGGISEDNGMPVLKWNITYPVFSSDRFGATAKLLTIFYYSHALNLRRSFLSDLYPDAVNARKNGTGALPYEALSTFETTYNRGCLVSLYRDTYQFTGGAHGNTMRTAETWNLKTKQEVPICALFPTRTDCEGYLLRQIQQQILLHPALYFEHADELAEAYFDPKRFYLTPDALVLYYGQYEIAPYSSGMPAFSIPYDADPVRLLCL